MAPKTGKKNTKVKAGKPGKKISSSDLTRVSGGGTHMAESLIKNKV